jgi:endoglucanase
MVNKTSLFALSFLALSFFASLSVSVTFIKEDFWKQPKRGANVFNKKMIRQDIKAAKLFGINFIRLAPDKFSSKERDFLIGNADHYQGLVKEDLNYLKEILTMYQEEEMPVVLTMLSLPGSRWKQNNGDKDDLRIWTSPEFQMQAAQFWQDLCRELKDYSNIVGINILNEPHPERLYDKESIHINEVNQAEVQNTLFEFYKLVISEIRKVDVQVPIILDSSSYGDSKTFMLLKPQNAPNILYSFHMYEPFIYTNAKLNGGRFSYPGNVGDEFWDAQALKRYMQHVSDFQKKYNIPSSSILVGEFGGNRQSKGLDSYFKDLLTIFREQNWHYAFYAFREDDWEGMDYELGNKKVPLDYWEASENGEDLNRFRNSDAPVFTTLKVRDKK